MEIRLGTSCGTCKKAFEISRLENLKKGWEDEDDDTKKKKDGDDGQEESDADAAYGNLRDKGKAVKFTQMRQSLPAHILQLYDEVAKKKASPRAFRSQIVNTLFRKLANGRYELRCGAPFSRKPSASLRPNMAKRKKRAIGVT